MSADVIALVIKRTATGGGGSVQGWASHEKPKSKGLLLTLKQIAQGRGK